ncbi:unnamed protein product [Prorocentrum cordatum]|uniref:D-isomer specific 2-hydroxyacid dehydrogenase NAD-binding domain-containing protein n=1 Tax=Prorocentrum cordatum TaxID=2364126 RepID=A0ABN9T466_9DINO|nr:unnamed protein product [Polarella glacialis]
MAAPPVVLVTGHIRGIFGGLLQQRLAGSEWAVLLSSDDPAELARQLSRAVVLVGGMGDTNAHLRAAGEHLRLLQVPFVGTEWLDERAVPPGVAVCNVHDQDVGISEWVLCQMLQWICRTSDADALIGTFLATPELMRESCRAAAQQGADAGFSAPFYQQPPPPKREELRGKTLGIVGFGSIGRAVAARAAAFGVRLVATAGRRRPVEPPLEWLGAGAADLLQLMRKRAVLINVSRGPVVDEAALFSALREGSGWTAGREERCAAQIVDNLARCLRGEPLCNVVGYQLSGVSLRCTVDLQGVGRAVTARLRLGSSAVRLQLQAERQGAGLPFRRVLVTDCSFDAQISDLDFTGPSVLATLLHGTRFGQCWVAGWQAGLARVDQGPRIRIRAQRSSCEPGIRKDLSAKSAALDVGSDLAPVTRPGTSLLQADLESDTERVASMVELSTEEWAAQHQADYEKDFTIQLDMTPYVQLDKVSISRPVQQVGPRPAHHLRVERVGPRGGLEQGAPRPGRAARRRDRQGEHRRVEPPQSGVHPPHQVAARYP